MFGWLLGKDKKHQARASSKSTARKPVSHSHDAQDSVLPDLTQQLGHSKAALEEASSRAMQQRREQPAHARQRAVLHALFVYLHIAQHIHVKAEARDVEVQ